MSERQESGKNMDLIDGDAYSKPDRPGIVFLEINGEVYTLTLSDAGQLQAALGIAIRESRKAGL